MTRSHTVHWTAAAEADALTIVEHFDDEINADKVLMQFGKTAEALGRFPESGRIVPELRTHFGETRFRETFQRPWRMIYRIDGHNVYIIAVVDGRRDVKHILFERIIR